MSKGNKREVNEVLRTLTAEIASLWTALTHTRKEVSALRTPLAAKSAWGFTPAEQSVYECLSLNVITPQDRISEAMNYDGVGKDTRDVKSVIRVHIHRIRTKLKKADAPFWIETAPRLGFILREGKERIDDGES
jgi:DNA-binding response OmpR family regulator